MSVPENRCLSLLRPMKGGGYCPRAVRELWGGARVRPELPFDRAAFNAFRSEHSGRMSISGVQEKISLKLDGRALAPVTTGGEYLLKPVPKALAGLLELPDDVPANEHATMQIASQVFGIRIAACGLVFFPGGEPALAVRRFDRDPRTGRKLRQEDFCQLSGRSRAAGGPDFKYNGSHEEVGNVLRRLCPAWKAGIERLYRLIAFNYVFGNGDAHLKNFSLLESAMGDHLLSPAYDLLCTGIHLPNESRTALAMFAGDFETESFRRNGFLKRPDFLELANRFGMDADFAGHQLDAFAEKRDKALELVDRSLMTAGAKARYRRLVDDRVKALRD
jgi:serine/threonine-protein kinase HipA